MNAYESMHKIVEDFERQSRQLSNLLRPQDSISKHFDEINQLSAGSPVKGLLAPQEAISKQMPEITQTSELMRQATTLVGSNPALKAPFGWISDIELARERARELVRFDSIDQTLQKAISRSE